MTKTTEIVQGVFVDNSRQLWGREPVLYLYIVTFLLTEIASRFPQLAIDVPSYAQLAGLLIAFVVRANVSPARAQGA